MIQELPITVRRSIEILGICALGALLILGQDIFMPLLMAFFISLLLLPLFRFFRRFKVPEVPAIVLCIVLFILIIAGVGFFISWQIGGFVSDMDKIKENLTLHWNNLSSWISSKMHFTAEQQIEMLRKQGLKAGDNATGYLQGAFVSLSGVLIFVGLIPIYIFLLIFYRNLLVRFVFYWFKETQHDKVEAVLRETESIVKFYLFGLMIQIGYMTILVGGILMIIGIKHALLIGIIFAILNLIPYVGALIGNLIGVVLTLTTSQELWQVAAVLIVIAVVQFLDNNILMPRIVGSRVKVNALASIVGIVIGGAIAGVSGMFLSIPIMAVLKLIFDKSGNLRQWGILLGDERPALNPLTNRVFRIRKRS